MSFEPRNLEEALETRKLRFVANDVAREFPENAMTLWVRIKLSSPNGVGRVVAEGPELVARSDNEAREPETVVLRVY